MNHDRDPGHRVLPWSPYDPTRNKLPEGAFSWRRMLDDDLRTLELGHPDTVNYVKQSAKIFCNYSVDENGVSFCRLHVVVAKIHGTIARPSITMCEGRSTRKAVYASVQGAHLFVSSIWSLHGTEATTISHVCSNRAESTRKLCPQGMKSAGNGTPSPMNGFRGRFLLALHARNPGLTWIHRVHGQHINVRDHHPQSKTRRLRVILLLQTTTNLLRRLQQTSGHTKMTNINPVRDCPKHRKALSLHKRPRLQIPQRVRITHPHRVRR